MNTVKITPIPSSVKINVEPVSKHLPQNVLKKIDEYWSNINSLESRFSRGIVFDVSKVILNKEQLNINLQYTDYAHYLYSTRIGLPEEYRCRVVHGASLIITSDNHILIGTMNSHTANPGRIQLVAGGLDENDIENGFINIEKNIKREINEEIGINIENFKSRDIAEPWLLKEGGSNNSLVIIYLIKFPYTKNKILKLYSTYEKKLKSSGILPEFKEINFIPNNKKEIENFLSLNKRKVPDYLGPLLIYLSEVTIGTK